MDSTKPPLCGGKSTSCEIFKAYSDAGGVVRCVQWYCSGIWWGETFNIPLENGIYKIISMPRASLCPWKNLRFLILSDFNHTKPFFQHGSVSFFQVESFESHQSLIMMSHFTNKSISFYQLHRIKIFSRAPLAFFFWSFKKVKKKLYITIFEVLYIFNQPSWSSVFDSKTWNVKVFILTVRKKIKLFKTWAL